MALETVPMEVDMSSFSLHWQLAALNDLVELWNHLKMWMGNHARQR
jgi:hypothetical protein